MAVITVDTLVEGMRRDDVLEWLSDREHHEKLVRSGFSEVKTLGPGDFDIVLSSFPRQRVMEYRFADVDTGHGGRRVKIAIGGRRTKGAMHYSLRTMKPSTNTLVTLHLDYDPGGPVGFLADASGMRQTLEDGMKSMLAALQEEIGKKG